MIAALLVCLQAGAAHGPEPGPRQAVAQLAGFRSVSRVDFGARQNRLTAIYVFPDRARWHFENYAAQQRSQHQFFYRQGERVHEMSGGPSHELTGEARDAVLLQMELRRAAMLWPEGFAWRESPTGTREAAVQADACCAEGPLGSLLATMDGERPTRIEARDVQGRVLETLEIRAWQESGGRSWPRTLALSGAGGGFVETVEAIETRVHYLELSFVPPDLRQRARAGPSEPSVMPRDLVAMTYARHELPSGTDWDVALARARQWIEEARTSLAGSAHEVDPVPTFELSSDGRPARCLVRLGAPALQPPAGYETRPERAGLFLALQELRQVDGKALERLARAGPEEARPGLPYVRIHARPNLPIELVLPLEEGD